MSYRHLHQEIGGQRLLLVVLEDARFNGGNYRHICATVIRRAVPHKMRESEESVVMEWNDDFAEHCSGYRVASYNSVRKDAVYVDDMQLRGQIDVYPNPLNNGRPYGNKIGFKPYCAEMNSAKSIFGFFLKLENFRKRHNLKRAEDSFYVELNHLAQFLKITTVAFHKPGVRHCSLAEANCFEEIDIALCEGHINKMLAPFYKE